MPVEIERKFLVQGDQWRAGCTQIHDFRQGYLMSHEGAGATVRVRLSGEHAFLTVKGAKSLSRAEYEYPIPPADAEEILHSLCGGSLIEKRRHCVPYEGLIWSVDVFSGTLPALFWRRSSWTIPSSRWFCHPGWAPRSRRIPATGTRFSPAARCRPAGRPEFRRALPRRKPYGR